MASDTSKGKAERSKTLKKRIPVRELEFTAVRSGGPGGQNVNKVDTKVELRWKYLESEVLSDVQKKLIATAVEFRNKINRSDEIVLQHATGRSQHTNKTEVIKKLHHLLDRALTVPEPRKNTGVPRASKEKRLIEKNKKKVTKAYRKNLNDEIP